MPAKATIHKMRFILSKYNPIRVCLKGCDRPNFSAIAWLVHVCLLYRFVRSPNSAMTLHAYLRTTVIGKLVSEENKI